MTKEQITEQSNLYKFELNDCKIYIDECQTSINTFSKIKNYFLNKTPEKEKLSNICLVLGFLILPISVLCLFASHLIGIILLSASLTLIERHFFFKKVTRKFKHCENIFTKAINTLTEKQSQFIIEKENVLEQICKLENEIPEEIIETIAMIENDKLLQINNNSVVKKCIERINESEETCNL